MNRDSFWPGEAGLIPLAQQIKELERKSRRENLGRSWYKFSRNPLSVVGGGMVLLADPAGDLRPVGDALPKARGPFTDFANAKLPPGLAASLRHRPDRPRHPHPDHLRAALVAVDGRGGAGPGRAARRPAGSAGRLLPGDLDRHRHHAHHRHLPGRAAPDPGPGGRLGAQAQPAGTACWPSR